MKSFFLILLFSLANGISVRQFSDDSCTQLSRLEYLKTNCYSFSSTSSYYIKSCNCTLIEYNLYSGALCMGNFAGPFYTQQNTCMSTRQMISCYEIKPSIGSILDNSIFFFPIFLVFFQYLCL